MRWDQAGRTELKKLKTENFKRSDAAYATPSVSDIQ
jgi:hypothetical protein